jgi:hypothetical protein
MPPSGPSRLVYLFPALALAAVLVYYLYGAVDRLGLEAREGQATVTAKQVAAGSTTYNTQIAGGRAWTLATENQGAYIVTLDLGGELTGGAVEPELYASLREGQQVRVRFQRTRLSGRILVTQVRP